MSRIFFSLMFERNKWSAQKVNLLLSSVWRRDKKIKNNWKSLAVPLMITKCLSFFCCACIVVLIFCPGRVATFCVGNVWA